MPADKRTYANRRESLIKAVTKRRKTLKLMAIEYKGGKCASCGYKKYRGALELHHLDPSTKSFAIGHKGYTRSWQKIKEEIDKCILLCANCHREVAAGVTQLSGEIQIEKRGELLETLLARSRKKGNQQPSPEKSIGKGSETISQESSPSILGGRSAPP